MTLLERQDPKTQEAALPKTPNAGSEKLTGRAAIITGSAATASAGPASRLPLSRP